MADERVESVALPRGVWYESKYNRYRVRLYKGRKAYLAGYFKTAVQALKAYKKLKRELSRG